MGVEFALALMQYEQMVSKEAAGLGELLRYVSELVEQGAEDRYAQLNLNYRARYTPVLRALSAGATTVTDITARSYLTQGAISQAVALMKSDGLICRYAVADGRKSGIRLTPAGRALIERLQPHWAVTFRAIGELEREIGHPLRRALEDAARALEQNSFAKRLATAELRRAGHK